MGWIYVVRNCAFGKALYFGDFTACRKYQFFNGGFIQPISRAGHGSSRYYLMNGALIPVE